jgi:type IV pilus assembly protein PilW
MGLAYALDRDADGLPDTAEGGQHLIWAVDSDNDNFLDTNIDTNKDGAIDELDDANGDGRIDAADGGELDPPQPLTRIRAVRIWLMARTRRPVSGQKRHARLVVGDRIIRPLGDGYGRYVISSIVACRNL